METREYTALPPEFSRPAPEFAPPPSDEFGNGSGPQTPKKKNRKYLKWLYSAAVLIVAGLAIGKWGGSSAASGSFPVSPRQPGDPEVTISRAVVQRAASSDYSVVAYKFSLDNHDTEFPIYLFTQVTDINGKKTELPPSPSHVREKIVNETGSIETTGLYNREGMVLTMYAGWETEDGGLKWVAASRPVEDEVMPDVKINIEKAVYVPAGNSSAHVEYHYTIKADPETYPFSVYATVEDQNNYGRSDTECPYVVSSADDQMSGIIYVNGMEGDLRLRLSATFAWEDGEITMFEEKDVDMSAKTDEPSTYPLGTGNLVITVYNNTFDMNNGNDPDFPYLRILLHTTIPEAEFSGLTLPEPDYTADDGSGAVGNNYDAAGYVLHYNSEFDYGYNSARDDMAFARRQGSILLKEDVELVPPDDDGNRYVNIHVVWKNKSDGIPEMEVILDLGNGDDLLFDGDQPFASEGYFYLAQVPDPEREGYTFMGWYDDYGNKVDYISYYDFYPLLPNAQSREDRDWNDPQPVILHAGWKQN